MKRSKSSISSKVWIFTLIFTLFSVNIFAFRASPVKFDLKIPRGGSEKLIINYTGSQGSDAENLMIYPTDISMLRSGDLQFKRRENFEFSAVPWLNFDQEKMRLIGTEKKQFAFEINVPRSATPGEYYVAIMSEPSAFTDIKSKEKPFMLKMKSRVAIVIIINVPGRNYQKEGEVFESQVIKNEENIQIISTFENKGNTHLYVNGKAVIRSKDGTASFGEVGLSKRGGKEGKDQFVFPKNLLDFHGTFTKKLPKGEYVADISFDYGYDFKKANDKVSFSIERDTGIDESEINFISSQTEKLQIGITEGAFRTKMIQISSSYPQDMKVLIKTEGDWLKVAPYSLTLRPAQNRTLKVIIDAPDNLEKKLTGKIIFYPEKGKSSEIPVEIMTHEALKELAKSE